MTDPAVDLSSEAIEALCLGLEAAYGPDPFSLADHYPLVRKNITTIRALSAALADAQRERDEVRTDLNDRIAQLGMEVTAWQYLCETARVTTVALDGEVTNTRTDLATERADHARTRAMLAEADAGVYRQWGDYYRKGPAHLTADVCAAIERHLSQNSAAGKADGG